MRRVLLAVVLSVVLTGCGFHLRGQAALQFQSIYLETNGPSSFADDLVRTLRSSNGARIVENPKDAQVILQILSEARERAILSLSGSGRVREITLRYRVNYRVAGQNNQEYIPSSEIVLRRDLSYNDTDVIAKEQEEGLLYRDMQNDAVQQLLRRLQTVRLAAS